MKLENKNYAIKLRKRGKSYSDILKVVPVSKGTLSKWLKNVPLSNEQRCLLRGRAKSRYEGAKANQLKAQQRKNEIIKSARVEIKNLIKSPLFVAGLMLYWAEGTKNGNTVAFTNSNSNIIKLMMYWFREICKVPENKFRVLIFIHSLLVNSNWQEEWIRVTSLPRSQFIQAYVKSTTTKHRKNKLYNGTCTIRINSIDLLSKITGWQKGFLELLGIQ